MLLSVWCSVFLGNVVLLLFLSWNCVVVVVAVVVAFWFICCSFGVAVVVAVVVVFWYCCFFVVLVSVWLMLFERGQTVKN